MKLHFKLFWGILLLQLLPCTAFSQERDYLSEMYAAHHGISQKEGTTELLKDLLETYGEEQKEIFTILFAPQMCPRCEADITYALDNIKRIKPKTPVIVIAAYPDANAARKYVKEKFGTDAIVADTTNLHEKIFHYRAGRLGVTYLLQIDAQKGRLMCGGDTPTMDEGFLRQFCHNTTYMPYAKEEEADNRPAKTTLRPIYKEKGTYHAINIRQQGFSVSGVLECPEWQGDAFLYADELLSKGMLFKIEGDTAYLEKEIAPTETQERAFSKIPVSQFNQMKQKGFLFIMANCVAFTPHTKQAVVSYSLPDLSFEKDSSIAYFNKPVLLETMPDSDSCKIETFDFEHHADTLYMYTHAARVIPINERLVLIGCRKGFPTTCTAEDCRNNKVQDIFNPNFYDDTPFCAIFDRTTGKLVKRFGHLDEVFKASQTGYYFTIPIADAYADRIVFSDGCSGKLWVTGQGTETTEREISLFDVTIPEGVLASVEPLRYTEDYFNAFFSVFHRYVEMIKADSQGIHCLIRHGANAVKEKDDTYEYRLMTFEGETLNKFQLQSEQGDEVLSINLGKDKQGKVFLYYMCKNGQECSLKIIPTLSPKD